MTKVDKIVPEDWVTVDKIGRTEILGPAKNGLNSRKTWAISGPMGTGPLN